ncbi:MAG: hypothetical protein IKO32_02230, partial [Lachnospiraceae bacterium]|nr:hypothetical protein [Lachnospiraceae bacterium]
MLIVEKIRKDYNDGTAVIYSKNTPELTVSDIPAYPENTVLSKDRLGNLHAIDYLGKSEEVKRRV